VWKPDYELMNYSILTQRPAVDQLSRLHFAPTTLVENLQRSGWSEIHQTGNTVIDALLSVQQSASLPAISAV